MNGLDYDKYRKYYHKDYDCDLGDRISLINNFMDYGISPLEKSGEKRDALKIADILGLNSKIINYAKKYNKRTGVKHYGNKTRFICRKNKNMSVSGQRYCRTSSELHTDAHNRFCGIELLYAYLEPIRSMRKEYLFQT